MPFLTEGGFGALDGVPGQFPVSVQPVRVAHHDDDAVLAVAGRQVLGHLGGQVLGGDAHVKLAAFDLGFAGRGAGGVAGGGDLNGSRDFDSRTRLARSLAWGGRLPGREFRGGCFSRRFDEGLYQIILGHAMPAGDALPAGQGDQGFFGAGLQLLASHAKPLPRLPDRGALKVSGVEPSLQATSRRSVPGSVTASDPRVSVLASHPARHDGSTDGVRLSKRQFHQGEGGLPYRNQKQISWSTIRST